MPTKEVRLKYGEYKNDGRFCKRCGWVFMTQKWRKQKYCSEYCKNHRKGLFEQLKSGAGEKAGNWKGGITPEIRRVRASNEYAIWRDAVFARDDWTCQDCGEKGGRLCAHHIIPFAKNRELRLVISNGITLCEKCHKARHRRKKVG